MEFIKLENLKLGSRIAKPIYNEKGVLLFGRGTRLNEAAINNIKSTNTYGIYILDELEPLPHVTEAEMEFERLQAIQSMELQKILDQIKNGGDFHVLEKLAEDIEDHYSHVKEKMTFIQTMRGPNDQLYKHSLNVASLACMIAAKLGLHYKEYYPLVFAALVHDIGKLYVPPEILNKAGELTSEEMMTVHEAERTGYNLIRNNVAISATIRRYISQFYQHSVQKMQTNENDIDYKSFLIGTKILKVADIFDLMTSMRIYKNPVSEYAAICYFYSKPDRYDTAIVDALSQCIRIIPVGACVELTNGEKGLVVKENPKDIRYPVVLSLGTNQLYDLRQSDIAKNIQIKDILHTFDNRIKLNLDALASHLKKSQN